MQIIGVIDLKDGRAVHARGGRRELYAPLQRSAGVVVNGDPLTLAHLYAGAFGLTDIYVADLDAIGSARLQDDVLRRLGAIGAALWIDAGIADADDARRVLQAGAGTLVIGLETLPAFDALADICGSSTRPIAFSLDLRGGTPMTGSGASTPHAPETIARLAVNAGAQSIIVLDVARVGAGAGPDLDLLRRVRASVPKVPLLAGGGVGGLGDLRELAHLGCTGALVATALHDGRLTPEDIAAARAL